MIQSYFRFFLTFIFILMPNLLLAANEYVPRIVSPIRIGFLSDTHFDDAYYWTSDLYVDSETHTWPDAVARATEYMQSRGCQAVVNCGDLTIGATDINEEVIDWFQTNITDRNMQFIPVAGNHETKHEAIGSIQPDTVMYPNPDENPFQPLADAYPNLFTQKEMYYKYNIGRYVKLIICNNLTDTTNVSGGTWHQRYSNCNLPGKGQVYWKSANSIGDEDFPDWEPDQNSGNADYVNPDYGGFETPGSNQWNWIISELESDDSVWNIPIFHAAVFAYNENAIRPNRYGQRYGLIAEMTERNVPLIAHGDTHVLSLTHNIHTEESGHMYARDVVDSGDLYAEDDSSYSAYGIAEGDSIGAKFLNLRSGLYRAVSENTSNPSKTFPNNAATDVAFYQDSPDTTVGVTDYTLVWFSVLSIDGDNGYLELFNISINGSGELTPVRRYHTAISKH